MSDDIPQMDEPTFGRIMKIRATAEKGYVTGSVYELFIQGHLSREELGRLAAHEGDVTPEMKRATQTWLSITDPAVLHMASALGMEDERGYADLFHAFALLQGIEVGTPGQWTFQVEEAQAKLDVFQYHCVMEVMRRMGILEVVDPSKSIWEGDFSYRKGAGFPRDLKSEEMDKLLRDWVQENSPMLKAAREYAEDTGEE
jgi:hypothetical protein